MLLMDQGRTYVLGLCVETQKLTAHLKKGCFVFPALGTAVRWRLAAAPAADGVGSVCDEPLRRWLLPSPFLLWLCDNCFSFCL